MNGIIILAAGASTRLGQAKQTLQYKHGSLLKHTVHAAVHSGIGPVAVVIGANEALVRDHIADEPVFLVSNPAYESGMATSIHAGLNHFLKAPEEFDNIVLMVCDQPHVSNDLLKNLLYKQQDSDKPIVACSYKNTIGVPAIFNKSFFVDLLSLQGDEGGKKILVNNLTSVATIPFPAGSIDIDTIADYQALLTTY
jgi:molybdenum cofactor cytidylyltransferase